MANESPPPVALPKPVATWRVVLCTIFFPVCLLAVVTASAGLYILTDSERESWLAKTQFAEIWRDLIVWNPMVSNLLFNGGMIGAILCFTVLRKHRQGKLLKNVRILTNKEISDARSTKGAKKRR